MDKSIIDARYDELGYEKGWTFMVCPEARLRDAEVAMVGTNPGGGGLDDAGPFGRNWSHEPINGVAGNAWCWEPSKHQEQVRLWHDLIGLDYEASLCAQFIPFRSPGLRSLQRRAAAEAFGRELWSWVLSISPAKLFITMGETPAKHLRELLGARTFIQNFPTRWGDETIDVYQSDTGYRIIRMPHPSLFRVLGRVPETDAFFKMAASLN